MVLKRFGTSLSSLRRYRLLTSDRVTQHGRTRRKSDHKSAAACASIHLLLARALGTNNRCACWSKRKKATRPTAATTTRSIFPKAGATF
eukprot:1345769-Prymnesium_polylepis.1